jgi:hypothetical protein
MNYSAADKLHEIERTLTERKRLYPAQIAKGTLGKTTAEKQNAILREIAEDYRLKVRENPADACFKS